MEKTRGKVLNIVEIIRDEEQSDYKRWNETMELRFGRVHLNHVHRVKFNYRNQQPIETLCDWLGLIFLEPLTTILNKRLLCWSHLCLEFLFVLGRHVKVRTMVRRCTWICGTAPPSWFQKVSESRNRLPRYCNHDELGLGDGNVKKCLNNHPNTVNTAKHCRNPKKENVERSIKSVL